MNAAFVGMPLDTATAPTPAHTPAPPPAAAPTQVALALAPRGVPSFAPAPAAPVAAAAASGAAAVPPYTATTKTRSAPQSTAPSVAVSRQPSDAPVTGNALADPVIRLLHARGLMPSQVDASSDSLLTKVRDATSSLVTTAMKFIGVRYTWGGTTAKTGFDCSGFTRFVFDKSLGVALPRRSVDQARSPDLQRIDQSNLKPGDLVFFNTLRSAFSHVGIYVGEGKFIHAPRTGSHVRVDNMNSGYWAQRFNGARRAPQAQLDAAELDDVVRSAEER